MSSTNNVTEKNTIDSRYITRLNHGAYEEIQKVGKLRRRNRKILLLYAERERYRGLDR